MKGFSHLGKSLSTLCKAENRETFKRIKNNK